MKKTKNFITAILLMVMCNAFAQPCSRLAPKNGTISPLVPISNFMYVDTNIVAFEKYRTLWAPLSDLHLGFSNINNLQDSLNVRYTKTQVNNLFTSFGSTYTPTWSSITGKPSFASVATSGDYNDLSNKPTLFSGSYIDLTNKPTIPAAQVNSDWTSSSGVSQILNKPTLSSVATSGDYNDLSNKPSIPSSTTVVKVYGSSGQISNPKEYVNTVNTNASGIATFTITDTGISSGTAIFTNVLYNKAEVNDNQANYNYSYTLSGDKKTMTVTVTKVTAVLLGLLQFNSAPANTPVNLNIKGN